MGRGKKRLLLATMLIVGGGAGNGNRFRVFDPKSMQAYLDEHQRGAEQARADRERTVAFVKACGARLRTALRRTTS